MKRIVLACTALFLVPWLSGCCCCGTTTSCGGYNNCVPYGDAYSGESYGPTSGSNCSSCNGQVTDNFSLPPLESHYPMQSGMPAGTIYGPEIIGPEIVGPEYVPNGTEWQQVAPQVPVTPAAPNTGTSGSNALLPPAPIPGVSNGSIVVPAPSPFTPASTPASGPTSSTAGPEMPPVPPPPPEPVSQMRFRQYR